MGHGCDQVVRELAFHSDSLCSNPAEAYSFSCKIVFEKNENKQKEAWVDSLFLKKNYLLPFVLGQISLFVYGINSCLHLGSSR